MIEVFITNSTQYIAHYLLLNNEENKWVDPSAYGSFNPRLAQQDDEIFHLARSINCVHFKNVVSEDFIKVLIGLPNVGKGTNLDLLAVSQHFKDGLPSY